MIVRFWSTRTNGYIASKTSVLNLRIVEASLQEVLPASLQNGTLVMAYQNIVLELYCIFQCNYDTPI